MIPIRPLPLASLGLALCACVPESEGQSQQSAQILRQAEAEPDDCLLLVWSNQKERRVEFDRAHDFADGGAISCATGTSASQFDSAIKALREAAKSGNKARILELIDVCSRMPNEFEKALCCAAEFVKVRFTVKSDYM